VILWPPSGSRSDRGGIWVEGTAEAGTFITLLDGGWYTVTLERPTGGDGRWAGEMLLHGGVNRIVAVAGDTTCVASPPSNPITVTQVAIPPLYTVGLTPTTVVVGAPVTLWATARGDNPAEGAPTVAVWAWPPDGSRIVLTATATSPDGKVGRWTAGWAVPGSLPSGDYAVFYRGVDADNLSGRGETALAVRNGVAPPRIVWPSAPGYVAARDVAVYGEVGAGYLTVRVYDGEGLVATTVLGAVLNWGAAVTLVGEGPHPLRARAEDRLGQVSGWSEVLTLTVDTTPPVVTMGALSPYTNTRQFIVAWEGRDPAAGGAPGCGVADYDVQVRYGAGGWSDWLAPTSLTATTYWAGVEGEYGFRARARDRVGNQGAYGVSVPLTCTVDWTVPGLTLTLAESSPYAHVSGSTLYYGLYTGTYTVVATVGDGLAGLAEVAFPNVTAAGAVYALSGAASATRSHAYTFTAASAFSGAAHITATDRATNVATRTVTIIRDATPPEVWLNAPARIYTSTFTLTWGASDAQAGVAYYDLDVSVDGGEWQGVLSRTAATSYEYRGEIGHHYTFRLTATDHVSNAASALARTSVVRVTKYYYHGGARVALRTSGAGGSVVYWLHGDHLGSVSLVTDASGQVVARQLYQPYGTVRYTEGTFCQEPDVNVPPMFTHNAPPMFTQNAPGMFARNVPPMFTQNAPGVFTRMHHLLRACPAKLRAGSEQKRQPTGSRPLCQRKGPAIAVIRCSVLRLFQQHLLFQAFAALSAKTLAPDDEHLGAMQQAIQARRGQ